MNQGQNGLTLVELLIVLAIFGAITAAGLSFGSAWADSNRVIDAENLVNRAFSFARAASLRNQSGVVGIQPAAVVCGLDDTLSVRVPNPDVDPSTGVISTEVSCSVGRVIWHNPIHERLSIKIDNGDNFECACLNNRGQHRACAGCPAILSYSITSGGETSGVVTLN